MKDYIRNQRGRMFDSAFFEFFSKIHPSMPFIFWLPVAFGILGYSLANHLTTLTLTAAFFPLGWVTWQLLEYFIHKKVFHWEGSGPFTRRFHDIVHGFHHKYPDDDTRLVMPLPVSISLAALIGFGLSFFNRTDITVPLWSGLVLGYLWYDFLHWSTHHRKPLTAWGRKLRAHHMSHHFADSTTNYGISYMWLDRVLGTLRNRKPGERDAS